MYRALEPVGDPTLADVVRLHLRCHGPSSRQDLAWWSGLPLGTVDRAVEEAGDLERYDGPLGRTYLDVAGPPPRELPGVRLLPEFDSLLCAYDSKARDRFVDAGHHARLWNPGNGLMVAPLLVDGRITGFWRLEGSGRTRRVEVHWFAGTRRPRKAEVEQPALEAAGALGLAVGGVTLTRAPA